MTGPAGTPEDAPVEAPADAPAPDGPLLSVRGLRTWFLTRDGVVKAVDGVDLTVHKGEVVGLVGESGSGKSVTSLSVMGLVDEPGRVIDGEITFAGQDLRAASQDELRALRGGRIAMIFQQPISSLNPSYRVLPSSLTPLVVQSTLGIATAVLELAALSFVGLGGDPDTAEWGRMIALERNQLFSHPHLVFWPGLMIMLNVLAFNLIGDGLRDALDPRLNR